MRIIIIQHHTGAQKTCKCVMIFRSSNVLGLATWWVSLTAAFAPVIVSRVKGGGGGVGGFIKSANAEKSVEAFHSNKQQQDRPFHILIFFFFQSNIFLEYLLLN